MSRVVKTATCEFEDSATSHRRTGLRGQTIEPNPASVAALEASGAVGASTDTAASLEAAAATKNAEYLSWRSNLASAAPAYVTAAVARALAAIK